MNKTNFLWSLLLCLFFSISCNNSDEGIEQENNTTNTQQGDEEEDDVATIITGDDVEKATQAYIVGTTVTTNDSFNFSTIDLDVSQQENTIIEIIDYDETYTYQLKLTGLNLKEEYLVDLTPKISSEETNVESNENQKMELDLDNLNMKSDFYEGVVVELNSSKELSLSILDSFASGLRFIDQRGNDFLTTIRVSAGGIVSSNGHDITVPLGVDLFQLVEARAYTSYGLPSIAFYDSNMVLKGKTSTHHTKSSNSGFDFDLNRNYDSSYSTISYVSPNRFGITTAGYYLVRLETYDTNGDIARTSPLYSFKLSVSN